MIYIDNEIKANKRPFLFTKNGNEYKTFSLTQKEGFVRQKVSPSFNNMSVKILNNIDDKIDY